MSTDNVPRWPGDPSSVTLRKQWELLRAKVERLEGVAAQVARELREAQRDLAKVERLASGGQP